MQLKACCLLSSVHAAAVSFLFLVSLLTESCSFQFCYNAPEFYRIIPPVYCQEWYTGCSFIWATFLNLKYRICCSTAFAQERWCFTLMLVEQLSADQGCVDKCLREKAFWGTLDGCFYISLGWRRVRICLPDPLSMAQQKSLCLWDLWM